MRAGVRHRAVRGSTVLFVDTQQYLDLYRLSGRKLLLGLLVKVSNQVFITSQIADEVTRNKVSVAKKFFTDRFKGLAQEFKAIGKGLPDQLFSDTVTSELQAKLNAIPDCIDVMREAADKAVVDLLQQIGRSEDEVSRVLAGIFSRAVDANQSELDCARARKERGRAPGKPGDALGDQINWEQFLTVAEKLPQVWIISADGDYCHKYAETVVLNAALYYDLTQKRRGIEVRCFTEMEKGLRDFVEANRVPDAQLPTADEAQRINKEQEGLPPRSTWLDSGMDDANMVAILSAYRKRQMSPALWAAISAQGWIQEIKPDPDKNDK